VGYFRVSEDGTLATSADDAFELPPNAFVRLMHPARDPADELQRFGELFGDYGIIQPFEQLSRPVVAAEATETGKESKRYQHRKVPSKRMFSLEKRGWTRTIMGQSSKVLGDATATLHYSPGIDGSPDAWQADEQDLGLLKLDGITFEELDVVVRSELLYDVERLFATE
ncbi:MAG: DUF4132 domain-containing protein, partial [Myxococcales bacterium]|nr:DUF4132 domain-containing protein [Myxococcales bacterium]